MGWVLDILIVEVIICDSGAVYHLGGFLERLCLVDIGMIGGSWRRADDTMLLYTKNRRRMA